MEFVWPKLCIFMGETMHLCALHHGIVVAETIHCYGRNDADVWPKLCIWYTQNYACA